MLIANPRQAPLLALLAARAISETGTMLSGIALPLLVWTLTESTTQVGIMSAIQAIPLILAGLAGGPVVDRFGAQRMSVLSDGVALVMFGCIPLLFFAELLPIVVLALLVFAGCCAESLGQTARASLTPDLAHAAGWSLERANAAVSAIGRAAIVLGPLAAGILISLLSPASVLLIDAVTFGLSALILAVCVPGRPVIHQNTRYWREMQEGLQFLRHERHIIILIGIFSTFNLLINPIFLVILPVYTSTVLHDPTVLGWLIASFGIGTLGGAIGYGIVGSRLQHRTVLVGCFILIALAFWPLTLGAPLPAMTAALLLMGCGVGPCGPLIMTMIVTRTPAQLRGRIFGIYNAGVYGGIPVGVLLAGHVMASYGIQGALLLLAAGFALLTGVLIGLPRPFISTTTSHS